MHSIELIQLGTGEWTARCSELGVGCIAPERAEALRLMTGFVSGAAPGRVFSPYYALPDQPPPEAESERVHA